MANLDQAIEFINGQLSVPHNPTIPFIPGDGIGPEVWQAARKVIDQAIYYSYSDEKSINWKEALAGEKSANLNGEWLPETTLESFTRFKVGIKGPLTTPVGGGIRSINVTLRKKLDLYACVRPVRYFTGVTAPVRFPEKINMVIFRENTEDLYAGIEFAAESEENKKFFQLLSENFPEELKKIRFPENTGIGIKPISKEGSQRLVRSAIQYAIQNQRSTVTLIHKGNIMKFTEGSFRNWGYELAESEFSGKTYTKRQFDQTEKVKGLTAALKEKEEALGSGKIWINDVITDAAFQQVLLYPEEFDVIASSNLNGDYLSDAIAAQVGGIGIAPGGNINYSSGVAIFEATHGTAPAIAGKNLANPSSLILSGEMMLRYLGWTEAADLILLAVQNTIMDGQLTQDIGQFIPRANILGTQEFAEAIIDHMTV